MPLALQDDEKLKRARALSTATVPAPQVQPEVTPIQTQLSTQVNPQLSVPSPEPVQQQTPEVQPPPAGDPYKQSAQAYSDRASALEAQARPPAGPHGLVQSLIIGASEGLQGAAHPGGFAGFKADQQNREHTRQQDLFARAKQYREEGQREQTTGLTEEQRQIENRRADTQATQAGETAKHQRAMDLRASEKDANTLQFGPAGSQPFKQGQPVGAPIPKETPEKTPREYGISEYQADMNKYRAGVGTPEGKAAKQRADDYMATKTQPGVTIQTVRGEEARKTGEEATSRKEVTDKFNDFQNYDTNYKTMKEAYDRVTSGKSANPGTDDMVLLFRHIGMTIGAVKGGRVNQAAVEAHLNARPLTDRFRVMYDNLRSGKVLSPAQREEMLNLGQSTRDFHKAQYDESSKQYQWSPPGADTNAAPESPSGGNKTISWKDLP